MHVLVIPSWYPQFEGDPGGSFFREQAIALAKGINMDLAQLDSILVFRTVNGQRMAAKFDLNQIRNGDAADPQIFGDDIIVVGVSSKKWAYRKFLESIPLVNAFILY